MKDTVIKGDGTSRTLKAPASMPETFEEWRSQLLAGNATMDIGLNSNGCTVVGTAMSKANLLSDTTKAALELSQSDPTVNDALYALTQKTQPAVLNVITNAGVVVTATKGSKVLSATADSSGLAVLYPYEFGTWTLKATINGKTIEVPFVIDTIAVFNTYLTTDLEAASWVVISAISEAGNAASIWPVGATKTIKFNGVSYTAQIIGFNHDTKTAGGKAGITFQLVDCLNTTYDASVSMDELFVQLDEDLQRFIKPVNKLVAAGNNDSTIETISDKLFLLSEVEIFGSTTLSFAGEGSQYNWYKAGNTKVKKVNGSAFDWSTRSPESDGSDSICFVSKYGQPSAGGTGYNRGVSFGFCI